MYEVIELIVEQVSDKEYRYLLHHPVNYQDNHIIGRGFQPWFNKIYHFLNNSEINLSTLIKSKKPINLDDDIDDLSDEKQNIVPIYAINYSELKPFLTREAHNLARDNSFNTIKMVKTLATEIIQREDENTNLIDDLLSLS